MSKPFAKLFDTPHGQLLAYLDEDDEGNPGMVVRGAARGGISPAAKLSWETEEKQQAAFDKLDQEAADSHAKSFHEMLENMFPKSIAGDGK